MSLLWPKRLRTKFYLGMVVILLSMGFFFGATLYFHLRNLLDSQIEAKADLVFHQVEAVQDYVRTVLRPTMYKALPEDQFIIEAMSSSFISRQIMERLGLPRYQYLYRRVALNARNPKFEANAMERTLIEHFRAHPGDTHWSGTRRLGGSEYYLTARPVSFDASCMHCHGNPAEAPRELIDRYGAARGFGTPVGEVRGVDLVGVLVQDAVLKIKDVTSMFIVLFGAGTLLFFLTVTVFFNRLVVHNLRRLTDVLHRHFYGQADAGLLQRISQGDEIDEMVGAMEELARHLGEARQQLEQHSANLERMVDERTLDLRHEAGERHADVQLFVNMLGALNRSQSRRELAPRALERIVERFGAAQGSYTCSFSDDVYTWPPGNEAMALPDNWRDLIAEGRESFTPGRAVVPVLASGMSRGLLCLAFDTEETLPLQAQRMLLALGQQMGIALENLDALDNLLRQMDILKSIFSGIADPLLLADESCRVLLANQAALDLSAAIVRERDGPDEQDELNISRLFGLPGSGDECPLRHTIETGQPASQEVLMPGGRSFSLQLYPLVGYEGQRGRLVVYAREITAEKQMQLKLQQTEKIIAVGKLAAGLAHEINNPLGVIMCYAQLLTKSVTDPALLEDLEVITRHTRKAQSVLHNLLNFARPKTVTGGPCDLANTVDAVLRVFSVQAETRKVRIETSVAHDLPLVATDASALEQILTNLLLNALDAVPPEQGVVSVSALHVLGGDEILLKVADNGPGVPDTDMGRIFDPFFSTKEVGKGSGLGLAVVFGLVRDMGGRIQVENKKGAVFTLSLPIHGAAHRPTERHGA
ncbi:MAG: DUF3365 domain-containing protein [Desulfovibrionaceae bacterium]